MKRGNSSVGRAQPCQGWGREFESRFPLTFGQVESLPSPGGGMVDALVSGASVSRRAGSSPVLGTRIALVQHDNLWLSSPLLNNINTRQKEWRGGGIGRRATLRG